MLPLSQYPSRTLSKSCINVIVWCSGRGDYFDLAMRINRYRHRSTKRKAQPTIEFVT